MRRFFSFWFYPVAAALLFWLAGREHLLPSWPVLLLELGLGLLGWTLLEYLLHRFLFHGSPGMGPLANLRRKIHLHHHRDPRDPDRLLVRPLYSLPLSALLGVGLWQLLDFPSAVALLSGLWLGFLYYESVHYRIHRSAAAGPWLRHQRRNHFHHHFVDDSRCFGVTSPLWDLVFRTGPSRSSS